MSFRRIHLHLCITFALNIVCLYRSKPLQKQINETTSSQSETRNQKPICEVFVPIHGRRAQTVTGLRDKTACTVAGEYSSVVQHDHYTISIQSAM